jgi:hypothetical protein
MQFENEATEWSVEERELMSLLPREAHVPAGEADRIAEVLRAEGAFRPRRHRYQWALRAAAAVALLLIGGAAGAHLSARGSLETMLEREDLTTEQRILLLQRAGSAYVQAAHAYANATSHTDSTAVEVASQVLIGAAQAVARSDLDGGLSPRLTAVLASARQDKSDTQKPLLWF